MGGGATQGGRAAASREIRARRPGAATAGRPLGRLCASPAGAACLRGEILAGNDSGQAGRCVEAVWRTRACASEMTYCYVCLCRMRGGEARSLERGESRGEWPRTLDGQHGKNGREAPTTSTATVMAEKTRSQETLWQLTPSANETSSAPLIGRPQLGAAKRCSCVKRVSRRHDTRGATCARRDNPCVGRGGRPRRTRAPCVATSDARAALSRARGCVPTATRRACQPRARPRRVLAAAAEDSRRGGASRAAGGAGAGRDAAEGGRFGARSPRWTRLPRERWCGFLPVACSQPPLRACAAAPPLWLGARRRGPPEAPLRAAPGLLCCAVPWAAVPVLGTYFSSLSVRPL